MKQHIAKLLLAAMLLSLASCGGEAMPADDTTGGDTTPEVTTAANPKDSIPTKDFGGAEFTILAQAEGWEDKYQTEETGDLMDDAIYMRNRSVEEKYNIRFKYKFTPGYSAGNTPTLDALRGSVMAGDAVYDMVAGNLAYAHTYILSGLFANLMNCDKLNFSDPWWHKNINDNIRLGDKLYTAAGAYALNTYSDSWCYIYNKELLESLKLENPWPLVESGKWTFDVLYKMAETAAADLNGNNEADDGDRYGVSSPTAQAIRGMAYGMGYDITLTDPATGIPKLSGSSERTVDLVDKLATLMNNKEVFYQAPKFEAGSEVVNAVRKFCAGEALFMCNLLYTIEYDEMRAAPDFGILPLPKFEEKQEHYYTTNSSDYSALPLVVKNEDMSQLVMNALNCHTYYDVVPTYKSVVLQNKLTRDEESAAAIDLIWNGSKLDFGFVFQSQLDGGLFMVDNIIRNSGSFTTYWASVEKSLETKLQMLFDDFAELPE